MKFASGLISSASAAACAEGLLDLVTPQVRSADADLALLFSSAHFEDELTSAVETVHSAYPSATLIGCTAESVIGGDKELEGRPAMSLIVGSMPGAEVRPFRLNRHQHASARSRGTWEALIGVSPESEPVFIALADPFNFDILAFVEDLNDAFPGCPLFGGVASAAEKPGQNVLVLDGEIHRDGLVGVALCGNVEVEAVVSQGCRPIGKPFIVTKSQNRFIKELGGKVAWEQLQTVINELTEDEEHLAQQALFVGRAINEYKSDFRRGDFLVQTLLGVEKNTGALAIAGIPKIGSTVQFHVRDAAAADEDLRQLLSARKPGLPPPAGALLFSCNGRGSRMWPDVPHHDAGLLHEHIGETPTAGFFCSGEFGPIGGRNFVHGFTASIALLRPRERAASSGGGDLDLHDPTP